VSSRESIAAIVTLVVLGAGTTGLTAAQRAPLRVPPSIEAVQKHLVPGDDAFPEEREAAELAHQLGELSTRLRARPVRASEIATALLAPDFKGAPLTSADEASVGNSPELEVFRARTLASAMVLDRVAFAKELAAIASDFESIQTAEFLITSIAVERASAAPAASATSDAAARVRTTVRFDLVGPGKQAYRAQRVGRWQLTWRRVRGAAAATTAIAGAGSDATGGGEWRIVEWTAVESVRSRAATPMFTEVTETALGRNVSYRQQLRLGLDEWLARLDGTFVSGGMGHHGVSVGDADGDGLDDLYVAQPAGLPNRLFHNNGDGTFTDVTEAAGLALLDGTSQSLFADIDNDGDQDLILITRDAPLLFINDGKGHFTRAADAFPFKQRLQGTLTSASIADYDRDGFLDLYLCVYAYVIGATEDKAGPPTPYHDAQHGPPNILLRNDGHGHFVDVTAEVGLDQHNDRFSFASAWADYDGDGWPDLLVANDFGRKNLYHNDGLVNGRVHFTDVAAAAGVEDYGAGMSAAFLDYDNDGHLDIYTGNMWSAAGQRITALPGFKPDAPADVREKYHRHARGNSLFRNKGDGTFADVTVDAHAEFGRWAWSSDSFDFDGDGWPDIYIVNGMFTRNGSETPVDVDSLFWRHVVAASPLTRQAGTAYDDGWRATNRLLMANGAQAQHERNVLLRNNGKGGFDDVSGSVGLDLDQDGRSFAVMDLDGDGDADLIVMAPRSSPQLRVFRNDYAAGHAAALSLRLIGKKSNRDAVGARVTVETDTTRATRVVTAGSGFLSQHSKQLLFGLGRSERIVKLTIGWPSGDVQTLSNVPINQRVTIEEGSDASRSEPLHAPSTPGMSGTPGTQASPSGTEMIAVREQARDTRAVWLYQPFPAPDFTARDIDGQERSLASTAGHPRLIYFADASHPNVDATALKKSAATVFTLDANQAGDIAGIYNVVHRYLFDRRIDMRLPTAFLLDANSAIVKIYSGAAIAPAAIAEDIGKLATARPKDAAAPAGDAAPAATTAAAAAPAVTADASAAERLARALPFHGVFISPPGDRGYFQYGLELSEQGYDAPALAAFERVAMVDPSAITLYNLGTLYMKAARPAEAQTAFERALAANPDYADVHNTLGALIAQRGDFATAITHFRRALAVKPDYADAMNNLGFVLFQNGQPQEALTLYQRALQLQPDFPEALNNVGIFYGQQRDLAQAESYFKQAVDRRPTYGEATNNLALVLGARGDAPAAIALLERWLTDNPTFEPAYVTLCRLYVATNQPQEGVKVLERLLQRNPTHPQGLQLLKQLQAGR
jgi:Flp pilus assembly protein TadD